MESDELARLMAQLRPRLHRYCARMVGSAFDGEDIVQEALASAMESYPMAGEIKNPEGWLFRIAHNGALDVLRRRKRQLLVDDDDSLLNVPDETGGADHKIAATAGLATLLRLPVIQRSTVVLVDVLGYSLLEAADLLGLSLPAVKSGLHRGRGSLQKLESEQESAPRLSDADGRRLRDYVELFNARDFDSLRGLLADEVRLDLVNRTQVTGRKDVANYFTRYKAAPSAYLALGWAENRPALLVSDPTIVADGVAYVILLDWTANGIGKIRDFRFAPYVMQSLEFVRL
jgi:RNA polymerase sigma-70 factor (ECF subfamily)